MIRTFPQPTDEELPLLCVCVCVCVCGGCPMQGFSVCGIFRDPDRSAIGGILTAFLEMEAMKRPSFLPVQSGVRWSGLVCLSAGRASPPPPGSVCESQTT